MSEQLKQQTLYNVSEANTKNLIWVDVYVSGTEGSAGTYASRRMTKAQLITFLNSNLSVAWSTIASKPTTINGYGITDAINGYGTNNYLTKWSGSNSLADSIIRDNGISASIFSAPDNNIALSCVMGKSGAIIYAENTKTNGFDVSAITSVVSGQNNNNYGGIFDSKNGSSNYGAIFMSGGATIISFVNSNIGTISIAQKLTSGISIGGHFQAAGTTTDKYAVRLVDGTELAGKFLKCVNNDGRANWASLAISDVASLQTSLDAKSPLTPRVQTVASSATVTPVSTNDLVTITAQAVGLTLANPTGTFVEGQSLMIRIKDNGTARAITFGADYRAIGITLPTTTAISKTMYLGIIYNSTDGKWDILGLNQQA